MNIDIKFHSALFEMTGNADAFWTAMRLRLKIQFDNIDNNLDKV